MASIQSRAMGIASGVGEKAQKIINFAWSKAQKKISINDINFLESLILAQDERWRRA